MTAVTIIGTGNMGKGIATAALRGGYDVIFHSRQPAEVQDELLALPGASANNLSIVPFESEVTTDVVVLATPYSASPEIAKAYGDKLADKTLVDISNAIDWQALELIPLPAGSSAEQIAQAAPQAHVVKAFNTIHANLLYSGKAGGLPLDVFVAGDDETAKQQVIDLIDASGMRGVDCGPLVHARGIEDMEQLFVNMKFSTKAIKAIKIVND